MTEENPVNPRFHPIQLSDVGVKELRFDAVKPPSNIKADVSSEHRLFLGHSNYDPESKKALVAIRFECGKAEEDGFEMAVELVGTFVVIDDTFHAEKVDAWVKNAAFYILLPFLREQIHSLTARVGFAHPIILPLMQVPAMQD